MSWIADQVRRKLAVSVTGATIHRRSEWWPRSHPFNSVGRCVVAGFSFLVLTLVGVVGGSAWLVREYQNDSAEMQQRGEVASLLQQTEANSSIAALLMQRYVVAGDQNLPSEIQASAKAAITSLTQAKANAELRGESGEIAKLDGFLTSLTALAAGADQMIALRQSG